MTSSAAMDFLTQGCRALGLACQPETLARLGRYYEELCRWNKKTNLVSARARGLDARENSHEELLSLSAV